MMGGEWLTVIDVACELSGATRRRHGARQHRKDAPSKVQVIAMLEDEGEIWATFLDGVSDEFLAETVSFPPEFSQPPKSRLEMILSVKEHEMHHRGQVMLVQRMLGIVPHLTREREARMAQTREAETS